MGIGGGDGVGVVDGRVSDVEGCALYESYGGIDDMVLVGIFMGSAYGGVEGGNRRGEKWPVVEIGADFMRGVW